MPVLDAALALKGPAGVTLDGAGVTALHLKGRGISGVDASLARACPSLAKLDLSDNVVRAGASVDALSRLSSLKNLNLANNDLDGAALAPLGVGASDAPDGGGGGAPRRKKPRPNGDRKRKGDDAPVTGTGLLPNLRVLNVSGNRLDALDGVRGAPNLGALIANENALESLEPIRGLRALNTVVASSNRIETVGDELRDLALLTKLSLSHNRIETLPGSALARCGALRELRLAHNRLKSLPPKLSACENLRVLDLSHNKFENWGDVAAIANLPRLQQLSMRGCPLASRPGYAETAAKMCASLRALDGRKIGPGGWVDERAADDRGAHRGAHQGAHQGAEDADAFAAARRAAGLDPLDEPEDDEMDEEERAMAEEVKALVDARARRTNDAATTTTTETTTTETPRRRRKRRRRRASVRAGRTMGFHARVFPMRPGRRVRVSCRRWWLVTWASRGTRGRRTRTPRAETRRRERASFAWSRFAGRKRPRGWRSDATRSWRRRRRARARPRGEMTKTGGGPTTPRSVNQNAAPIAEETRRRNRRRRRRRRRGDATGTTTRRWTRGRRSRRRRRCRRRRSARNTSTFEGTRRRSRLRRGGEGARGFSA